MNAEVSTIEVGKRPASGRAPQAHKRADRALAAAMASILAILPVLTDSRQALAQVITPVRISAAPLGIGVIALSDFAAPIRGVAPSGPGLSGGPLSALSSSLPSLESPDLHGPTNGVDPRVTASLRVPGAALLSSHRRNGIVARELASMPRAMAHHQATRLAPGISRDPVTRQSPATALSDGVRSLRQVDGQVAHWRTFFDAGAKGRPGGAATVRSSGVPVPRPPSGLRAAGDPGEDKGRAPRKGGTEEHVSAGKSMGDGAHFSSEWEEKHHPERFKPGKVAPPHAVRVLGWTAILLAAVPTAAALGVFISGAQEFLMAAGLTLTVTLPLIAFGMLTAARGYRAKIPYEKASANNMFGAFMLMMGGLAGSIGMTQLIFTGRLSTLFIVSGIMGFLGIAFIGIERFHDAFVLKSPSNPGRKAIPGVILASYAAGLALMIGAGSGPRILLGLVVILGGSITALFIPAILQKIREIMKRRVTPLRITSPRKTTSSPSNRLSKLLGNGAFMGFAIGTGLALVLLMVGSLIPSWAVGLGALLPIAGAITGHLFGRNAGKGSRG
ncbi:hypothetical protein ACFL2T_03945 [Elusimicrobiota bacterium]